MENIHTDGMGCRGLITYFSRPCRLLGFCVHSGLTSMEESLASILQALTKRLLESPGTQIQWT